MADYALIDKNGKVVNVIVADESFINLLLTSNEYSQAIERIGRKGNIGQVYENGKFYEIASFAEDLSEQIDNVKTSFTISNDPLKDFDTPGDKSDIRVTIDKQKVDFSYENKNITLNEAPKIGSILIVFYKIKQEVE
jgi:hypothetical protein